MNTACVALALLVCLLGARAQDCSIIVPPNPLTPQGMATPYQLVSPCSQADPGMAAFVQGAVINLDTGAISIYNPLVITQGTTPAIAPTVPTFPARYVSAVWFGFNGDNLILQDNGGSLTSGNCVNGLGGGDIFGQFAYCNAPAFFQAANAAIQSGKLTVPGLGTGHDGLPCPTTRDFSVVDQDQSDNVVTEYIVTASGQTAQKTTANVAALGGDALELNGSDNLLLDSFMLPALGCSPWKVNDLADPGHVLAALPLNELQAAAHQAAPVALVPIGDPMTLSNGANSVAKTNAYRVGVNQPTIGSASQASTITYCNHMVQVGAPRITRDFNFFANAPSPDPAFANLYSFLGNRFIASLGNLNCPQ